MDNTQDKIFSELEQMSHTLQFLMRSKSRTLDLSPLQTEILQTLLIHSSMRIVDLSRRFGLAPPTVSDAVRVLVAKNLIVKKKDWDDGRARVLTLTPEGKTRALSGIKAGETIRKKIALLSVREQETFLQSLAKLRFKS
ncbi:MAG: winged helix-turn-helix transcriptional regulator [Nitrospirae bacterium]|nr:winged helix-turn-helix transcriptional regulator [Nitrospirota bacterium]